MHILTPSWSFSHLFKSRSHPLRPFHTTLFSCPQHNLIVSATFIRRSSGRSRCNHVSTPFFPTSRSFLRFCFVSVSLLILSPTHFTTHHDLTYPHDCFMIVLFVAGFIVCNTVRSAPLFTLITLCKAYERAGDSTRGIPPAQV